MVAGLLALLAVAGASEPAAPPVRADRVLQVLPSGEPRDQLARAAERFGDDALVLGGVRVDRALLAALAATPADEPLLRAARERLRLPVDLDDLVLLLDDVVVAWDEGRRGEVFHVPSGRARAAGVLVHPDDVFRDKPRDYGAKGPLAVDEPRPPAEHQPAADGDPPGPGWSARFRNPDQPVAMVVALADARPDGGFASRVAALTWQLAWQGADVWLTSTLRDRTRGYLMWGAYLLSRAEDEGAVEEVARKLDDRNLAWKVDAPIRWRHPDGWRATVEGARRMAEAYDVVYATEAGARDSDHYDGVAVDVVAVGLPRSLTLTAPDGVTRTFDLSDPAQPRDLSLTPELITWVEEHFDLWKLDDDYPHWRDARAP